MKRLVESGDEADFHVELFNAIAGGNGGVAGRKEQAEYGENKDGVARAHGKRLELG